MGVSYYAHTFLGLKLDKDQIMVEQRERMFDHDHPDTPDLIFDPKTGKKLWTTVSRVRPELVKFDENEATEEVEEDENAVTPSLHVEAGFAMLYVVHNQVSSYRSDEMDLTPLADDPTWIPRVVEKLKEITEPLGLWDPNRFGIWTSIDAS